jgi:hypothetical protein
MEKEVAGPVLRLRLYQILLEEVAVGYWQFRLLLLYCYRYCLVEVIEAEEAVQQMNHI